MSIADYIALAVIILLIICAVRYMIITNKKGSCCGCCEHCIMNCKNKNI